MKSKPDRTMSTASGPRAALINELLTAGRKLGTATVLFHHAIAERMGLSATDHKYLEILVEEGPLTAGQLARLTGLTTGAITGVIDRLEKVGLVQRERDPADRRKVIIMPLLEVATRKIAPFFEPLTEEMEQLHARYSDEELQIIRDYIVNYTIFFQRHAQLDHKDISPASQKGEEE